MRICCSDLWLPIQAVAINCRRYWWRPERGISLTRRLGELARDKPAQPAQCDLVKTITEARVLLKPVLSSRIELVLHLPEQEVMIPCHTDDMTQMLITFGLSARVRMATQVTITVTRSQERAFFSFRDNGQALESAPDQADMNLVLEKIEACGGLTDNHVQARSAPGNFRGLPFAKQWQRKGKPDTGEHAGQ